MNMKKLWLGITLLCTSLGMVACANSATTSTQSSSTSSTVEISQAEKEWETIVNRGTLKFSTSGTLYPQSFHKSDTNELTGYDVEIMREVAKRLGLEVEFTEMGVDGMFSAVNSGQVDIAGISIDRMGENATKYLYTTPHKYSFSSMVVRKSDNSGIHSLEDLAGKKAAGAATTSYMKVAKKMGAELVIYNNVKNEQYLTDVEIGRTDVILNDFYLQTMALRALPHIEVKILEDVYYNPTEANFAIRLGNDVLLTKVNEQLEAMRKDGTLTKISQQFFDGEDVSVPKEYNFQMIDISDVE